MMMSTVIRITLKTKERLLKRMKYGQTYDIGINNVLDLADKYEALKLPQEELEVEATQA